MLLGEASNWSGAKALFVVPGVMGMLEWIVPPGCLLGFLSQSQAGNLLGLPHNFTFNSWGSGGVTMPGEDVAPGDMVG